MSPYLAKAMNALSSPVRILIVAVIMVGLHLLVILVRRLSNKWMSSKVSAKLSKSRTIGSLTASALVFLLYFSAFGIILSEFGVSLKAYLASASIMGLAIGFGSQGLVQDVVNGLTVVFSGLFDVGDMVEISGQTGTVKAFGMRFTVIENAFGAEVSIPNRTITNVVKYPRGYFGAWLTSGFLTILSSQNRQKKKLRPLYKPHLSSSQAPLCIHRPLRAASRQPRERSSFVSNFAFGLAEGPRSKRCLSKKYFFL